MGKVSSELSVSYRKKKKKKKKIKKQKQKQKQNNKLRTRSNVRAKTKYIDKIHIQFEYLLEDVRNAQLWHLCLLDRSRDQSTP